MNAASNAPVELHTSAAARLLGVDPRTLKRWTEAGRIPSRRSPTGRRLYTLADLELLRESAHRGA